MCMRSLHPSDTAITSASVDDSATQSCLLLALDTLFPFKKVTQPDMDRLVSGSDAHVASVNMTRLNSSCLPMLFRYMRGMSAVPFKYRPPFSNASMWRASCFALKGLSFARKSDKSGRHA